jgi:hypothetical protein
MQPGGFFAEQEAKSSLLAFVTAVGHQEKQQSNRRSNRQHPNPIRCEP